MIAPRGKKSTTVPPGTDTGIQFSITAETWRFRAYIAFWFMCAFAISMKIIFVKPLLLAGPSDESSCPPFERDAPELGLVPGEGFDVDTNSHLNQAFGFSKYEQKKNVCLGYV